MGLVLQSKSISNSDPFTNFYFVFCYKENATLEYFTEATNETEYSNLTFHKNVFLQKSVSYYICSKTV